MCCRHSCAAVWATGCRFWVNHCDISALGVGPEQHLPPVEAYLQLPIPYRLSTLPCTKEVFVQQSCAAVIGGLPGHDRCLVLLLGT